MILLKICQLLNIKQAYDRSGFIAVFQISIQSTTMNRRSFVPSKNTVDTNESKNASVKAFNGIGYASNTEEAFDPERIKQLVKKVQEDG